MQKGGKPKRRREQKTWNPKEKQSTTTNQANDGPHRRTSAWGAFSSNHWPAGFSTWAFPSVTRSLDEEAASLTSHGRASGRVRRHDRHLVPGCKPRHDPLANNAHSGPTTQSTPCRQPASRGSGEPPNERPKLEMP